MADGSRLRVRRRSIFSTLVSVLAIACFGFNSAPTSAQPTNNDYYKGAGTELLYNVEKYHLGPANDKRFDVIGRAVNITAVLPSGGVTLSAEAFRKLSPALRQEFKKHTPPITYIAADDSRPH